MTCIFDDAESGSKTMECNQALIQCGPGVDSCPRSCACAEPSGQRCVHVLPRPRTNSGAGLTVTTCGTSESSASSAPEGQIAGGNGAPHCDPACCSFVASGWGEKCSGVSCQGCWSYSPSESGSICSRALSPDLFLAFGCGYTDPQRQAAWKARQHTWTEAHRVLTGLMDDNTNSGGQRR